MKLFFCLIKRCGERYCYLTAVEESEACLRYKIGRGGVITPETKSGWGGYTTKTTDGLPLSSGASSLGNGEEGKAKNKKCDWRVFLFDDDDASSSSVW